MEKENKRLNVEDLNDVVTVSELAALIGVTQRMVLNMVAKDEIKSFRFGRCRLFLKQDILEMIGYSADLDKKQKSRVIDVTPQEPERPEARYVAIPRSRRGYEYLSMGD